MSPPSFIDWVLGLPLAKLALLVFGFWAALAVIVHTLLVPWVAGPAGRRPGRLDAGAVAPLGLMFSLLLSLNAVTAWEQYGEAGDAVLQEASSLREMADLSSELSTERRREVNVQLQAYLRYLIQSEWPKLGIGAAALDKPASLRSLAGLVRATSNEELRASLNSALAARESRIRIAASRVPTARLSLVIALGALTLLAVGLVHAEQARPRAAALSLVASGIACCLLVLFVHLRPFLGVLALKPVELSMLATQFAP